MVFSVVEVENIEVRFLDEMRSAWNQTALLERYRHRYK